LLRSSGFENNMLLSGRILNWIWTGTVFSAWVRECEMCRPLRPPNGKQVINVFNAHRFGGSLEGIGSGCVLRVKESI